MNRILLLEACEFAKQAVTGKTSLPILECLHLKGDGKRLRVTGANGDFYARMEVDSALVIDCCAPAGRLKNVLSEMTTEEVSITPAGDNITVRGNGNASVRTMPGGDFPELQEVTAKRFPVPSEAIKRVMGAASTDTGRYVLNGVFLDKEGFAVATDGRRMHSMKIEPPSEAVVIPSAVAALLADAEGVMMVKGGRFAAAGDGWSMGGKLIEGNYLNWRAVLPKTTNGTRVSADFIESVSRASRLSTEAVHISPDRVTCGKEPDDYTEDVETGLCRFACNPAYFLAALKAAGEGVAVCAVDDITPIAIVNGDFLAAIMPTRISQ